MRYLCVLLAALALAGCSTKNYGRQGAVSDFERQTMTCREIDLDTAKVHGYLAQIEKESEFDVRSVFSFLGDFGIGNTLEKNAAIKAANARLSQLHALRHSQSCGTSNANPTAVPGAK